MELVKEENMTAKEVIKQDKKNGENNNPNNSPKYVVDRFSKYVFFVSAMISVISLLLIIVFVFYKGLSPFVKSGYSFGEFFTGTTWIPSSDKFGILPMISASVFSTLGAVILGVPIGILTAVFLSEIASKKVVSILSPAVELLAGIPSVLYGLFGLAVVVPFIQKSLDLPKGQSMLAVILVLTIMMLPTIISVAENAIRSVPESYREASLALGATKIETIFKVVLPAAKSGILAAVILGIGRALGETMAVILVAGNSPVMPSSIMDSVRPLTTNIALEMGYAHGVHEEMLFSTGVVLFTFIMLLNVMLNIITKKKED